MSAAPSVISPAVRHSCLGADSYSTCNSNSSNSRSSSSSSRWGSSMPESSSGRGSYFNTSAPVGTRFHHCSAAGSSFLARHLQTSAAPFTNSSRHVWTCAERQPHVHQILCRSFAKAAAGKAAAAAAAAPAVPVKRRVRAGSTRLKCIPNDRLRHPYEQIWPTLALSEDDVTSFRRNSRLFVVDMARSITLKNKLRMGLAAPAMGPAGTKVPAIDARAMLYESNLHLDAIGEHPRYLKIRRLRSHFATKLQNLRKVRVLLGFQRRKRVQGMYEHSLLQPGPNRMWKLVCAMEGRLAMFITRMGMAEDIVAAHAMLKHHRVHLNGLAPPMPYSGYLTPGDVISPTPDRVAFFKHYIANGLLPLAREVQAVHDRGPLAGANVSSGFGGGRSGGDVMRRGGGGEFPRRGGEPGVGDRGSDFAQRR